MTTLWLDEQYLRLLSSKLPRFKQSSRHTFNARCVICGDSQTNKSKARWYAFEHKGKLICKCHNCGYAAPFGAFLQNVDVELHKQYLMDRFKEEGSSRQLTPAQEFEAKMKPPVFQSSTQLKVLKKISQLRPEHPVKQYVNKRLIPPEYHYKLYFAPKFMSWVNTIIPDKFPAEKIGKDEPRLIIPLLDDDKELIGFQGRSFSKDGMRYITIMLNASKPRIYGLESLDRSKDIYIVEGPIDAMFIPNTIATCGGDLHREVDLAELPKDKVVIVYDNEPRNKDTCKKIESCIDKGYRVCIWSDDVLQKDINDMVRAGRSSEKLVDIIKENTYIDLEAKMKLSTWRKC